MENSAEQGKPEFEKLAFEVGKEMCLKIAEGLNSGNDPGEINFNQIISKALQEVFEKGKSLGKDEQAEIDAEIAEDPGTCKHNLCDGICGCDCVNEIAREIRRAARKREK